MDKNKDIWEIGHGVYGKPAGPVFGIKTLQVSHPRSSKEGKVKSQRLLYIVTGSHRRERELWCMTSRGGKV